MIRLTYRCLLFAFPAESRARVGADLIDTLMRDVSAASGIGAVGRFFANAVDLVGAGVDARKSSGSGGAANDQGPGWGEEFRRTASDVKLAVRSLAKTPGFAAAAILSLTLGIGLNTTIFSVVNAVVLRPVPGKDPSSLVAIFTTSDGTAYSSSSYPDFLDLASQNNVFDGVMAHTLMFAGLERGDASSITVGEVVSPNYFDVLGLPLAVGSGFASDAARADAPPSAVISHRMWQRDFAGSASAIGRDITIRGRKYSIVGVAPQGFNGLAAGVSAELWVPVGCVNDIEPVGMNDFSPSPGGHANERRGQRYLFLTGRLKTGVSIDRASASVKTLMSGLAAAYPQSNANRTSNVVSASSVRLLPDVDRALAPASAGLMAAVGIVLLVACSNIASLLLARATARAREMALRVAIGASRWQIIRQLVVESIVLSLAGGVAGLTLALWLCSVLSRFQPPMQLSIAFDFAPDLRVFVFTLALALFTGVLFGLAPALRASRPNVIPALKGETELARTRRVSMRALLVSGQMALSMTLLVVAGLLLRSFAAASSADVRFDASKVVYAAINSSKQFNDRAAAQRFFDESERRLRALPGVASVARTDRLPFALTNNTSVVEIDGIRGPAAGGGTPVDVTNVSADYFNTLGIPIVRGRAIDARDRGADTQKVAVINETAARRFFPEKDAVGSQFRVKDGPEYTIVGVSQDHPVRTVGETPRPFFHFSIDQTRTGFANLIVRTNGSADALTPAVRRELLALEPRLAFLGLEPVTAMVNATLFPVRAAMVLLGAFSALALVLAIIGLYGVVSFTVARQTREIGIRMALGADRGRVIREILSRSAMMVGIGGGIGLLLGVAASQVLSGMLVGISPLDPITYISAALMLATAGLIASVIPARRAAAINPILAVRST